MPGAPAITCVGLEPVLADLVADAARQALGALGMGGQDGRAPDLAALEICADDVAGSEDGWLRLRPGEPGGPRGLAFYCQPAVFAAQRPATGTIYPPRAVWERREPEPGDAVTAADFSRARADAFLHHHLLLGRDVLRGELVAGDIPAALAEAFAAAWDVTIDGRLARLGLPGYSLADRRGRFSRLFSTAGVLMPEHWQLFQGLWDGAATEPREVLAACRRLPRLQGRARGR